MELQIGRLDSNVNGNSNRACQEALWVFCNRKRTFPKVLRDPFLVINLICNFVPVVSSLSCSLTDLRNCLINCILGTVYTLTGLSDPCTVIRNRLWSTQVEFYNIGSNLILTILICFEDKYSRRKFKIKIITVPNWSDPGQVRAFRFRRVWVSWHPSI